MGSSVLYFPNLTEMKYIPANKINKKNVNNVVKLFKPRAKFIIVPVNTTKALDKVEILKILCFISYLLGSPARK